jgi:serine protease Do
MRRLIFNLKNTTLGNYFLATVIGLGVVALILTANAKAANSANNSAGTNKSLLAALDFNALKDDLGKLFGSDSQAAQINQGNVVVVSEESQVIKIVKDNSPAVVSIIASAEVPKMEQCYQNSPFSNSDLFNSFGIDGLDQFFNSQIPSVCQNGTEKKQIGAGSGYLVSADGYIVTNKHVVANESAEYTVILNNAENRNEKVSATVLARDSVNDIAILKINKNNLPYVTLGDSDNLQVGQTVVAIGYALGQFDNTVSKGVVSGLMRSITAGDGSYNSSENLEGVIQTDAAINPGNSGGPLFDLQGKVIGMNVAIVQGSQNIGFALPINAIKTVYESVKKTGKIERAYLGIRYIPINQDIKDKNKLSYDYGVLIVRGEQPGELAIVPGSPADKAGLVENDILLEVDGQKLDADHSLTQIIAKHKPGDSLSLKIYDKGQEKNINVVLGNQ